MPNYKCPYLARTCAVGFTAPNFPNPCATLTKHPSNQKQRNSDRFDSTEHYTLNWQFPPKIKHIEIGVWTMASKRLHISIICIFLFCFFFLLNFYLRLVSVWDSSHKLEHFFSLNTDDCNPAIYTFTHNRSKKIYQYIHKHADRITCTARLDSFDTIPFNRLSFRFDCDPLVRCRRLLFRAPPSPRPSPPTSNKPVAIALGRTERKRYASIFCVHTQQCQICECNSTHIPACGRLRVHQIDDNWTSKNIGFQQISSC